MRQLTALPSGKRRSSHSYFENSTRYGKNVNYKVVNHHLFNTKRHLKNVNGKSRSFKTGIIRDFRNCDVTKIEQKEERLSSRRKMSRHRGRVVSLGIPNREDMAQTSRGAFLYWLWSDFRKVDNSWNPDIYSTVNKTRLSNQKLNFCQQRKVRKNAVF